MKPLSPEPSPLFSAFQSSSRGWRKPEMTEPFRRRRVLAAAAVMTTNDNKYFDRLWAQFRTSRDEWPSDSAGWYYGQYAHVLGIANRSNPHDDPVGSGMRDVFGLWFHYWTRDDFQYVDKHRQTVLTALIYGRSAVIAYKVFEDQQFLKHAERAWHYGLKWTLSEADVHKKIFLPKLITLSTCSGSSLVGGTFRTVNKLDSEIDTLTTGTFFVLSALLFEATQQPKYFLQATESLTFLENQLFLERETRLLNSLDCTKCLAQEDQLPDNYGVFIEGLAIWYDINKDPAVQTLLNDLIHAAIMSPAWQGEDGIIAWGPNKSGSINLIHGLDTAYKRSATSSGLRGVIEQYLVVQYNAIVDLATFPGTDIYGRWIGPASLDFSGEHQVVAAGALLAATTLLPHLPLPAVANPVLNPVVKFALAGILAAVAAAVFAIIALTLFGRWSGKRRRQVSRMIRRMGLNPGGVGGSIRLESDDEDDDNIGTIRLDLQAGVPQLDGLVVREDLYPVASGGNANVYRGTLTRSNGQRVPVAIKSLRLVGDNADHEATWRRMKREVRVWTQLKHPNVLPFLGVCNDLGPWPVFVSPFYEFGHVGEYLRKFPEVDRHELTLGVATGLTYLHGRDMVHGDLKVQNVLVNAAGCAVICDFGLSKVLDARGFTTNAVGTVAILAPELFTHDSPHTTKATDVYAFGLLALEIYSGDPPKRRPQTPAVTEQMLIDMQPRRDDVPVGIITPRSWALLERCWHPKLRLRPSMTHVLRLLESFERSRTRQRKRKPPAQDPHPLMHPSTEAVTPNTTYMCRFDRPQSCTFEVDEFVPTDTPTAADGHTLHWDAAVNEWAPMEEGLTPRLSQAAVRAKYAEAVDTCRTDWAWDDAEPGLAWLDN
ncbi:TKL/TKL-ccin protein kinase [Mycena chlorophos]|uniref:TKL/TKL-ccin protein kinase n=1 Tax=Mycena chlorophos TaxID=658473 RepID=A0A8H6STB7_MYCCL|nr:TKL/TKL-ccin protein kinase [Mycena chlorophos]